MIERGAPGLEPKYTYFLGTKLKRHMSESKRKIEIKVERERAVKKDLRKRRIEIAFSTASLVNLLENIIEKMWRVRFQFCQEAALVGFPPFKRNFKN